MLPQKGILIFYFAVGFMMMDGIECNPHNQNKDKALLQPQLFLSPSGKPIHQLLSHISLSMIHLLKEQEKMADSFLSFIGVVRRCL